tara:strand:+ start:2096 stop:2518 length:423 start_codon:yes stop_codon:yes gene_type:complete
MLSLEDLWASIVKDIHMDIYNDDKGMYCIYRGCRIFRHKETIKLYNCNTGSDNFALLSARQLQPFLSYGFKIGAEYLRLDNYRTEIMLLDLIILDMEKEGKSSELLKAKKRRTLLQNQAEELNNYLNKIKSHGYTKEIRI